jgi:hypothetical protein
MPRNDRSDSLSVRSDDDPRRPMRGMQNEVEQELLHAEQDSRAADHDPREPEREAGADAGPERAEESGE